MTSQKTIWHKFRDHEYAHAYFDEFLNTLYRDSTKDCS